MDLALRGVEFRRQGGEILRAAPEQRDVVAADEFSHNGTSVAVKAAWSEMRAHARP